MKKVLLILLIACFLGIGFVQAAEEPVQATGKSIWGDTKKKLAFIEGDVRIVQGSTVITSDKAEIDTDKKYLKLQGSIILLNNEITISSESLDYNLKKKEGTFKQNVGMQRSEVKNEKGKVTKEAFDLDADELYFQSDTKNFTAQGKSHFNNKDFEGSADTIDYSDRRQELLFTKNAYLKRPGGEEIRGEEVRIDLQDKSFVVVNNVSINFKVEEEPEPTQEPAKRKKK